jgi:predicted RNA-binding Zn ribbon-like protein
MTIRRPLTGEPLALDLVDTEWRKDGELNDLLATRAGHQQWLSERDLRAPATPAARRALLEARRAIRGVLEQPDDPAGHAALDRILARGRIRLRVDATGDHEQVEIAADWRVPWLAVRNLLSLRDQHATRVRNCANPACVLWFLDATRSGTRRWCSMATCGNRLKARRHYQRRVGIADEEG